MSQSKLSLSSVFSFQSWVHAVSGATGSVIAMTVFYPLDTVRSRLQLGEFSEHKDVNTIKILKEIVKTEGFSSLYRGLIPVLESLCISNFVYFYTFHTLKALIGDQEQKSAFKDLIFGCIAGAINVLSTTPFWVVNTRLKMKELKQNSTDDVKHYNNLIDGLIYIGRNEGIKSLWSGTIPSLMLIINPALQFMMYEKIKRKLIEIYGDNIPGLSYFAVGAFAKAFATVLTYPLQLAQTKLRHDSKTLKNLGTLQLLMNIVQTQGPKGLFRGLEAKMLHTVMTAALMFAAYEKIAKYVAMILISQKSEKIK